MQSIILILSDSRGIYIPRDFLCNEYNELAIEHCQAWGLDDSNKNWWIDAADPENEHYWDAWEWILTNAKYTAKNGDVYRLHQDGDLWAVCYEKMSEEEKSNFFFLMNN